MQKVPPPPLLPLRTPGGPPCNGALSAPLQWEPAMSKTFLQKISTLSSPKSFLHSPSQSSRNRMVGARLPSAALHLEA